MRQLFYPFAILLCLALSTSCYYDNKEDLYQNFPQDDCDTTGVSFSSEIEAIIVGNCAVSGCHVGASPQSGLDLSTYPDIKAIADNGSLVGRITRSSGPLMPPTGALPNCEIEKIKLWVDRGAKQD